MSHLSHDELSIHGLRRYHANLWSLTSNFEVNNALAFLDECFESLCDVYIGGKRPILEVDMILSLRIDVIIVMLYQTISCCFIS